MSTNDVDIEKSLRNLRECRSFSISRTVFVALAKAAVDLEMSRSRLLEVAARKWLTENGYLEIDDAEPIFG